MTKGTFISILFILSALSSSWADTHVANSCLQADVIVAYNDASPGDTVELPVCTETWDSTLVITKGITLKGAGIDQTIINSGLSSIDDALIYYEPANPELNEFFRVTGFTFNGNWLGRGIMIYNWTTSLIDQIRIDNNKFIECNSRAITWQGFCHGLVDNNEFVDCVKACDVYGKFWNSWELIPAEPGTTKCVVIENNTITRTANRLQNGGVTSGGQGGRYTFRYNTINIPANYSYFQILDAHGNQKPVTEEFRNQHRGTVFVEAYENTVNSLDDHYRFFVHRGGMAIVFNNTLNGASTVDWEMWEEDGYRIYSEYGSSPPFDAPYLTDYPGYDPIKDSYFWNNLWNGSLINPTYGKVSPQTDTIFIQQDRDYFLYPKPGYTPLEYPHPMAAMGSPDPPGLFTAASCSQADVLVAYNDASPGDTVELPACSETWDSIFVITKGITLKGAGIDQTTITGNVNDVNSNFLRYRPSNPELNEAFILTGFTFDGGNISGDVLIENPSDTPITNVRVHDNKFTHGIRGLQIRGPVYGVADHNQFEDNKMSCEVMGHDQRSWDYQTAEFGTVSAFFFEDNSFDAPTSALFENSNGCQFVFRSNTINNYSISGIMDMHGNNHTPVVPGYTRARACLNGEIYGNQINSVRPSSHKLISHRGGSLLMFDNTVTGPDVPDSFIKLLEYDASTDFIIPAIVTHGGTSYLCLQDHTSSAVNEPGTSGGAAYWQETAVVPNVYITWETGIDFLYSTSYDPITDTYFYNNTVNGNDVSFYYPNQADDDYIDENVNFWKADPRGRTIKGRVYQPFTYPHPLVSGTAPPPPLPPPSSYETSASLITKYDDPSTSILLIKTNDPIFVGNSISVGVQLPSGNTTLTVDQLPSDSSIYSAEVSNSLFSLSEFYSLESQNITLTIGTETVTTRVDNGLIHPNLGGTVLESNGNAQVTINPGAITDQVKLMIYPEPSQDQALRDIALKNKFLISLGPSRDISMTTSGTLQSASISLPYDPSLMPRGSKTEDIRIAYYNPSTQSWEVYDKNLSVSGNNVSCDVTHFSLYKPVLQLTQGNAEVYVYPNPVLAGEDPVIRVLMDNSDSVELSILDISGDVVHNATLHGTTGITGGRNYYDYKWEGEKSSGVYFALVMGKNSKGSVTVKTKFAVVK